MPLDTDITSESNERRLFLNESFPTPKGSITRQELEDIGLFGTPPDFMRPVMFLDHDGVLNLDNYYRDEVVGLHHRKVMFPQYSEFCQFADSTTIYWFPHIADVLRDTNTVWCTTWKKMAHTKLNKIYDFSFPWLEWKDADKGRSDWTNFGKCNVIGKIVRATGCDWISVDDELGACADLLELQCEKPGLIVAPDFELGLTVDEVRTILIALGEDPEKADGLCLPPLHHVGELF